MKRIGWNCVLVVLAIAAQIHAADLKFTQPQQEAADKLRAKGVIITQLAADSDALTVNFATAGKNVGDAELGQLKNLPKIVQLNLGSTAVTDAGLSNVAPLITLTHLNLDRTAIGDAGLAHLKGLSNLTYLNLYATSVTDKGIEQLAQLKSLKRLYLWQTKVSAEAADSLKKAVPELVVNRGEEMAALPKTTAPASTAAVAINLLCPVSGKPVDGEHTVTHDGKVIGFCCEKCPKQFQKDPKKFADKIKADAPGATDKPEKETDKSPDKKTDDKKTADDKKSQTSTDAKPAEAANTVCPISGEPVDSKVTLVNNGKTIAFCCEKCLAKFKADPANFAGKAEESK